jgi:hypothetical protein
MKGKHPAIDLHREFINVFNREEMLAFFDFQADTGKGATVSGLCKVSKPKEGKSDMCYFSLLFIIETPDENIWQDVDTWFSSIQWDGLKHRLPEFESVLSIPFTTDEFTGNFFQEIDVYVREDTEPSRSFILDGLCPAVRSVSRITSGEPVFWKDLPTPPNLAASAEGGDPNASLVGKLRNFLKI